MDDLAFSREALRREMVELLVKIDKAQNEKDLDRQMEHDSRVMHGFMNIVQHTFPKYGSQHSINIINRHPESMERISEMTGLEPDKLREMMEDM